MSAQSAFRRSKDRPLTTTTAPKPSFTAAGLKHTRSTTPTSGSDRNPSPALRRSQLSGKENTTASVSRSASTQRPSIKPVPRVEKTAIDGAEGKMQRWSTSTVPRGRSPSPSDVLRVFRDSKVSKGESDNRVVSSVGKKSGVKFISDSKENNAFGKALSKKTATFSGGDPNFGESEKKATGVMDLNSNCEKKSVLTSTLVKISDVRGAVISNLGTEVGSSFKFDCVKESSVESSSKDKVLESTEDKRLIGEGDNKVGVKHPSKLHEKLAFLEGKVKRIASDIKKTKDMLDNNNPAASKVILSDIQDKILGIEKAIGNVAGDASKNGGAEETVSSRKRENEKAADSKSSVKGLNSEELEARLFPHQKLLRNRTVMKGSSGVLQNNDVVSVDESSVLKTKEKLLSPVEENCVALEFLASLNKEETKGDAGGCFQSCEVLETDDTATLAKQGSKNELNLKTDDLFLTADEKLEDFDDHENSDAVIIGEEIEEDFVYPVHNIGTKNSTGGWFMSEGEFVLLAHDDGTCSLYDIANCEEKAVYKPPSVVSPNIWRDCWIIRAPGADGCSSRYVVAASAGNVLNSGFCSWDFYTRDVRAFHIENEVTATSRTVLGPLPCNPLYRRSARSSEITGPPQWWYRPCGPLIVASASSQKLLRLFDIRDAEQVMKWEVARPVSSMDYSSPLQWRNKGKVVIAEAETISVWDLNSLSPQSLFSISALGQKITALQVINTDAESGGGVRQRVSSAEAEGNDGVFSTSHTINVLDFRQPSGIGIKIPNAGVTAQSVFTRGDLIYIGCSCTRRSGKNQPCSQIQQFSLRKQRLVATYSLPESNSHSNNSAITQVWGDATMVMGVSGQGLSLFDPADTEMAQSLTDEYGNAQNSKEVIGPDDLYAPSFDYLSSRVLIISKDRPALWRYVS